MPKCRGLKSVAQLRLCYRAKATLW